MKIKKLLRNLYFLVDEAWGKIGEAKFAVSEVWSEFVITIANNKEKKESMFSKWIRN